MLLSEKVPLSVLVPTLDEELNLPRCLESVAWADQLLVVDSYSSDRTVEIARHFTPHVYQHKFENYSAQKNWALDNLPFAHEWVFILDADERASLELKTEIEGIVRGEGRTVGYYVNRRFIFLGRWIKHSGWYPSWNLRLFKYGLARYDERAVHEHMVVKGPVGYLRNDLLHLDERPLEAFVARHNRYSSLEATERLKALRTHNPTRLTADLFGDPVVRKRFLRERIWPRLPAKPLMLFLYMYFLRLGFLDGWQGFAFCMFHFFQELMVGLKMREMRARERRT